MKEPEMPDPVAIDPRKVTEEISEYQRPTRRQSIWQIVNSIIPYVALWFAAIELLSISVWLVLPVTIIASGFLVRIFIIFHDCGHGSFFRSKKANDFWGVVTGILTFTPYHYWRASHAKHHATSSNLDQRGHGDVWMMTVTEYMEATRGKRLQYRLYRNPLVMFILGPLLMLLVSHRFVRHDAKKAEKRSVYFTNLAIAVIAVSLSLLIGWEAYLTIQALIVLVAFSAGVWLFYVQHQFEDVYWARGDEWDFVTASLEGGSFYDLPIVLRWFTGSIGYHHIHHLNARIPNYNLARCQKRIDGLESTKAIGFWKSLKSLSYRLWDEEQGKLIGFGEARRRYKAAA